MHVVLICKSHGALLFVHTRYVFNVHSLRNFLNWRPKERSSKAGSPGGEGHCLLLLLSRLVVVGLAAGHVPLGLGGLMLTFDREK